MAKHEDALRRMALGDERYVEDVLAMRLSNIEASGLDPKTHALVRLGVQTRCIDVRELHRQDVPDVPLVTERHASERVLMLGHRPSSLRSSARHSTSGRTREHRPDGMKAGLRRPGYGSSRRRSRAAWTASERADTPSLR